MDLLGKYYFYNHANEIVATTHYQELHRYIQHGETTVLEHSISVAYYSYKLGKSLKLKCDYRSLIRGALLHDFFLYDWHKKDKTRKPHGVYHPEVALENALKHFELNHKERDIIANHMWPLSPKPPHYVESYLVWTIDKYCTIIETTSKFFKYKQKMPKTLFYNTINFDK